MPLINCIVQLKLKLTKYCVLASNGTKNADANTGHVFTIKDTKLYNPDVVKDNQKLSKLLSKGF